MQRSMGCAALALVPWGAGVGGPGQDPVLAGLDALEEMGEWQALGFYRSVAAGDSEPLPWAHAVRELYERMPIRCQTGLLMPQEPAPFARRRTPGAAMMQSPDLRCDQMFAADTGCLVMRRHVADDKRRRFPQHVAVIDAVWEDLRKRHGRYQQFVHAVPDIPGILRDGFDVRVAAVDRELAATSETEERHFLQALRVQCDAVLRFHERIGQALEETWQAADAERRQAIAPIRAAWPTAFRQPADSFVGGLLAITLCYQLDGCDSIGRLDAMLGELYERDLAAGRIDRSYAKALLIDLWGLMEAYNGWQVQLGGRCADGSDACNALTLLALEVTEEVRTSKPSLSLRVNDQTPSAVWDAALRCIASGCGHPALYSDAACIASLRDGPLAIPEADAVEVAFAGCTETVIPGATNCGSFGRRPDLVPVRALLRACFDGSEPGRKHHRGPPTGLLSDHGDWSSFRAALDAQLRHWADDFCAQAIADHEQRLGRGDPHLHRSLFIRGCIDNRRSFLAGGAQYNWYYVNCLGLSTLIDGAAAIRHCVYEQETVSAEELLAALRADFQGHEELQRRLSAAPRFGNDEESVDTLGAELLSVLWQRLLTHEHPRGGRFVPSVIPWALYDRYGDRLAATPDGRRAGAPLGDSIGAYQGRDAAGPTALLNSVARLPLHLAVGVPVCNIRLQADLLRSPAGRAAGRSLVEGFFARGGMHLQISALDAEQLRAAQARPEEHRDILVRIGGYSEYFVGLNEDMQESIIARTAHTVG